MRTSKQVDVNHHGVNLEWVHYFFNHQIDYDIRGDDDDGDFGDDDDDDVGDDDDDVGDDDDDDDGDDDVGGDDDDDGNGDDDDDDDVGDDDDDDVGDDNVCGDDRGMLIILVIDSEGNTVL